LQLLLLFGIDPNKVTGDPVYSPIVEIQILANPSGGGTTNATMVLSNPMYGTQAVTGGFLAIQSESQPIVFKDILLKELPQ
jgi:hypothetical protein